MLTTLYKTSLLKNRALVAGAITILATLVAFQFGYNPFYVAAGTITVALLLEGFFFYRSYIPSIVATLGFFLFGSLFVGTTYLVLTPAVESGLEAFAPEYVLFTVLIMEIILVISVIISVLMAYTLTRGKAWINIMLAGITYNSAYILLSMTGAGISFVFISLFSLGAMLIVLAVKMFIPRYKTTKLDPELVLPTDKTTTVIQTKVEKRLGTDYEPIETQSKLGAFAFKHEGQVYYVTPLAPEQSLNVFKRNTLMVDNIPMTGLLEAHLKEAAIFAKTHGLKTKNVIPVLYVNKHNELGKLTTIKVRDKNYPDKKIGSLHIVSPDGFYNLVRRNSTAKK